MTFPLTAHKKKKHHHNMSVLTGVHAAEHKIETYLAGVCFCDGYWSKRESAREGLAGCPATGCVSQLLCTVLTLLQD